MASLLIVFLIITYKLQTNTGQLANAGSSTIGRFRWRLRALSNISNRCLDVFTSFAASCDVGSSGDLAGSLFGLAVLLQLMKQLQRLTRSSTHQLTGRNILKSSCLDEAISPMRLEGSLSTIINLVDIHLQYIQLFSLATTLATASLGRSV